MKGKVLYKGLCYLEERKGRYGRRGYLRRVKGGREEGRKGEREGGREGKKSYRERDKEALRRALI